LFDSFADMIEVIPARAVLRTLERERRMLQEDLALQRPVPVGQAMSILSFCNFAEAVGRGLPAPGPATVIAAAEVDFYRKTVARLAASGELPANAMLEFDQAFAEDHLQALHYAM
jgi:hypothetical protein